MVADISMISNCKITFLLIMSYRYPPIMKLEVAYKVDPYYRSCANVYSVHGVLYIALGCISVT